MCPIMFPRKPLIPHCEPWVRDRPRLVVLCVVLAVHPAQHYYYQYHAATKLSMQLQSYTRQGVFSLGFLCNSLLFVMLSIFLPLYNSMFFSKLYHFLPHPTSYAPFSRLSSNLCFHRSISISLILPFQRKSIKESMRCQCSLQFLLPSFRWYICPWLSLYQSYPQPLSISIISSNTIHQTTREMY